MLLMSQIPVPATEGFLDNIHNDVYIRYMNFDKPDLSLDYGLVAGNLVLSTSRESMFAAIDALLAEPEPEAPMGEIDTSDWQIYTNEEYGFEITFTDAWEGYVLTERLLNWGDLGTSNSFDFGFEPQESLFNISIHSEEQWQSIVSQEGPSPQYISENDEYVFAYSIGHDLGTNKEIVVTREGIMQILTTFKFTE